MILSPSIGTLHHSLCLLKDNEASSLILCQASLCEGTPPDPKQINSHKASSFLRALLHYLALQHLKIVMMKSG